MPIITLTEAEMLECAMMGVKVHIHHILRGTKDLDGAEEEDAWGLDIESHMSEKAVAKWLYFPYTGGTIGAYKEKDVADFYQVRCTKYTNGCLRLTKRDKDEDIFIHVTGRYGTYNIRRWCYGREGKQERWWRNISPNRNKPKAFWIPTENLNELNTLPLPSKVM